MLVALLTLSAVPGESVRAQTPGRSAAPLPVLGVCDARPNYVMSRLPAMPGGATVLRRWATFPITYSVDTADLPSALQKTYAEVGAVVRDLWSTATNGRLATLRQVPTGGQITVELVGAGELPAPGFTTVAGVNHVITSASIRIARMADDEALIARGLDRRVVLQTVNTLAHEIGHALGIQLHSPDDADLMHEYGNFVPVRDDQRDPRTFITPADRNTMRHAYCR